MALAAVLAGCGGMDETYKAFRGDGPIVYLAKFPENSVRVLPGNRRLKMIFPQITDIRVAKGTITWWSEGANRTQNFEVNPTGTTELIIDTLVDEGSYVFSLTLYDETGAYSSLAATLNGVTYGKTYEDNLSNRKFASANRNGVGTMTIIFYSADVPPLTATRVGWKINNTTWTDTVIYAYDRDGVIVSPDTLRIAKFRSDSLSYSAIFKPEDAFIDEFVVGPTYQKEAEHKNEYGEQADWTS
jgi:hypothetical protein